MRQVRSSLSRRTSILCLLILSVLLQACGSRNSHPQTFHNPTTGEVLVRTDGPPCRNFRVERRSQAQSMWESFFYPSSGSSYQGPQGEDNIIIQLPLPVEEADVFSSMVSFFQASSLPFATEESLVVAVIDSGIDYRHKDLRDWMVPHDSHQSLGRNFSGMENTDDGMDDFGHGTHVAGVVLQAAKVILQNSSNGGSDASVALYPIRFMDAFGNGSLQGALLSIDHAIEIGARVINASWGTRSPSPLLDECIQFARSKGVGIIAAAGNDRSNIDWSPVYPARYNGVVSVGAIGWDSEIAHFSNYGPQSVEISTHGVNVLSTLPGDRWGRMSGTSMATPLVAGAIASLMARDGLNADSAKSGVLAKSKTKDHLKTYFQEGRILDLDAISSNSF